MLKLKLMLINALEVLCIEHLCCIFCWQLCSFLTYTLPIHLAITAGSSAEGAAAPPGV